jgi:hypothetical protein
MSKKDVIAREKELFGEKVQDLTRKLFATLEEGESMNIRLSSVLSVLITEAQNVPPESKFVIGACMEDCMRILGVATRTDTIH